MASVTPVAAPEGETVFSDIPFLVIKNHLEGSGKVPSSKLFWASRRRQLLDLARAYDVDLQPLLEEVADDAVIATADEEPPEPDSLAWLRDPILRSIVSLVLMPPVWLELGLKLLLAIGIYGGLIAGLAIAIVLLRTPGFDATNPWTATINNANISSLRVELTECSLAVSTLVNSSEIRLTDTSLNTRSLLSTTSTTDARLSLAEVTRGSCNLVAQCTGPSAENGVPLTAHLQIGDRAEIRSMVVSIGPVRSALRLRGTPPLRALSVSASATALVSIENATVDTIAVTMVNGLLELYGVNVSSAVLDLGTSALSAQLRPGALTRVAFPTSAYASASTDGMCLSDAETSSVTLHPIAPDGTVLFGPAALTAAVAAGTTSAVDSLISLTYAPGAGPFHVSRAVAFGDRSPLNTYDSARGASKYALESGASALVERMRTTERAQLMRLRIVGAGLPASLGGAEDGVAGEWLYALHGKLYLWHVPGLFWLATASLFAPKVARLEVLLTTTECLPISSFATTAVPASVAASALPAVASQCAAPVDEVLISVGGSRPAARSPMTMSRVDRRQLGQMHAMLMASVPAFSANNTAMLVFQHPPAATPIPSLDSQWGATSSVVPFTDESLITSFSITTMVDTAATHNVSTPRTGAPLLDAHAHAFVITGSLLLLLVPALLVYLTASVYMTERDEIIKAEGPRLWPRLARFSLNVLKPPTAPRHEDKEALDILAEGRSAAMMSKAGVPAPAGASVKSDDATTAASAKPAAEWQALRVLGESTLFLVVVDTVLLRRYGRKWTVDGLPSAILTVVAHATIVCVLCLPLVLTALLQMHSMINHQVACPLAVTLWSGRAGCDADGALQHYPLVCFGVCLIFVAFMLVYTCVEYLERHVDFLLAGTTVGGPPGGYAPLVDESAAGQAPAASGVLERVTAVTAGVQADAAKLAAARRQVGVSSTRRALVRLRSHWAFTGTSAALLLLMCLLTGVYMTLFGMYTVIAAAVDPEYMLAVLVAVIGAVTLARQTFLSLKKMKEAQIALVKASVKNTLSNIQNADQAAATLLTTDDAISEVLRETGLSTAQVLLVSIAMMIGASIFFAFVVLGTFFFVDLNSIAPSIVSSIVVASTTLVAFRGGDVTSGATAANLPLTQVLTNRLGSISTANQALATRVSSLGSSSRLPELGSEATRLTSALGAMGLSAPPAASLTA